MTPSLPYARSHNQRLEHVFRYHPDYVNREPTLPASVREQPVYLSDQIAGTPAEKRIRKSLRVIVTPETAATWPAKLKKQLRCLASPYECGRVLELDEPMMLGGVPHVLTLKGPGATYFCREKGNENPWTMRRHFTGRDRVHLQSFPFWQYYGVLDLNEAIESIEISRNARDRGFDYERVLAVYELTSLPDVQGVARPIEYFKQQGIIAKKAKPVIMVRATKSNFRLLDLVMLDETGKKRSIAPFVSHVLQTYRDFKQDARGSLQDYFFWLTRKVIWQELPQIVWGFQMSSSYWFDLGRNISILGEEIDVGDLKRSRAVFGHVRAYQHQIDTHFGNVDMILRSFANVINLHYPVKIDFGAFAECVWDESMRVFATLDYPALTNEFREGLFQVSEDELREALPQLAFAGLTKKLWKGRDEDQDRYRDYFKSKLHMR